VLCAGERTGWLLCCWLSGTSVSERVTLRPVPPGLHADWSPRGVVHAACECVPVVSGGPVPEAALCWLDLMLLAG
jgi:hypothetical protein